MARLIDAYVASERARASDEIVGSSIWETCEVVVFLDDCPTIDAVEVVRCKDCKWRQQDDVKRNFCGLGDFYCGDTDFCSRGERKDNG